MKEVRRIEILAPAGERQVLPDTARRPDLTFDAKVAIEVKRQDPAEIVIRERCFFRVAALTKECAARRNQRDFQRGLAWRRILRDSVGGTQYSKRDQQGRQFASHGQSPAYIPTRVRSRNHWRKVSAIPLARSLDAQFR